MPGNPRTAHKEPLSAKTLRWTFEEGSMAGSTFEHHFYADGTVAYHPVDDSKHTSSGAHKAPPPDERPKYKAIAIADDVVIVSYLGKEGYTLTVALNFDDGRVAGFASNDKEWFPCEGTFEDVTEGERKAA